MRRKTVLSIVGVAAVMLVIGTALGSVVFPLTKTEITITTQERRNSTSVQPVTVKETVTSYSTFNSTLTAPTATATQTITPVIIAQGALNVTELVIINPIGHFDAFVCGTRTFLAGTYNVEKMITIEYIIQSIASGTSETFPNATVTTVTTMGSTSSTNSTIETFTSISQGTTVCAPIP
jgi:hypothetical protein